MRMCVAATALFLLGGCAVDPIEDLAYDMEAADVRVRQLTVVELTARDDKRARELLVEALEDEELMEEAGNALVIVGRRYDKRRPAREQEWLSLNPVVFSLSKVVTRTSLDWRVRAKAVWVLGEIGNRKAKPYIEGTYAADSTRVAEEVALARDKLGFTDKGAAFELLRDGSPSRLYDAAERWQLEKREG